MVIAMAPISVRKKEVKIKPTGPMQVAQETDA